MPYSLGRKLRNLLSLFHDNFDPHAEAFVDVKEALGNVDEAIDESFPADPPKRERGRPAKTSLGCHGRQVKHYKNQLVWLRKKVTLLQKKIHNLTHAKASDGKLTPAFLTKVALSHPAVSSRGFAQTWQDLVGTKVLGCHRRTIENVRDAFSTLAAEVVHSDARTMVAAAAQAFVSAASSASVKVPQMFSCALLHIQDEAALRLRSFAATDNSLSAPVRSRCSKVQQHALWLKIPTCLLPLLTELDPLANKSAATLATSLKKALVPVLALAQEAAGVLVRSVGGLFWFVHIIVGDAVSTNEAACRTLRSSLRASGSIPGDIRYCIMVVKCANHQSNLVIGSTVQARAALLRAQVSAAVRASDDVFLAKENAGKAAGPHKSVCGTIVRLFKYLVNEYFSEFYCSLLASVNRLDFSSHATRDSSAAWLNLSQLYGSSVLPSELLEVLNSGCDTWSHVSESAHDQSYQAEIREKLLQCLRKHVLIVDEHPTLSRMFTFTGHIDRLLLVYLLQLQNVIFKITTVPIMFDLQR